MTLRAHALSVLTALALQPAFGVTPPAPLLPVPTPQQLAWQNLEFGMFCHFGLNTFHNLEWSDGTKDAKTFTPSDFNATQWVQAAKDAGVNYLVVTAKHHDGFATYQTAQTDYSVKLSPWREGKGDVVRDVADACHAAGLMFGFYLSPWDRHEKRYADSAAYDIYFQGMLRELLTGYGPIGEVWFDGAGSEGHIYNWNAYYSLIRELQPNALTAICGPDIRWVGNEEGVAPETLWNAVDRDGKKVWYPAECDVPIRKGQWFFHTDGEKNLLSVSDVLDIYYKSVGRGAVLLLNVAPDRRGQLPDKDVAVLCDVSAILKKTFKTNLAAGKTASADNVRGGDSNFAADKATDEKTDTYWATDDNVTTGALTVDFGAPLTFNRTLVQESIAIGQRVANYEIEAWSGAAWTKVVSGTTIGYKRLDRFPNVTASKIRLNITKSLACPAIHTFGVYAAPE